ncbi:MAG: tRNA glutamyl-Q(34) synthetase GluQRS [Verrucomicrobiota bacterium]|nr:tRNA glutamyl-Q(34) synthetase GluQRS [Verrucomicrobiota bacterium]
MSYRGRLAPSPTGLLHLGHARTFWTAQERARAHGGALVLRIEDLDRARCKPEFVPALLEDLRWFGFEWNEGPDRGGPFASYTQSERTHLYRSALEKLRAGGFIYPCTCSRKDIQRATTAPHAEDDELIYPDTCRTRNHELPVGGCGLDNGTVEPATFDSRPAKKFSWRFRIPDGEVVSFHDENRGRQIFIAGKDFGDFVVWRHDGIPAYQLACVVDDAAMQVTEVVRGADLLVSAARQLLLYRALGWKPPAFFHCPLLRDRAGQRLAKRQDALSLRALRVRGEAPGTLRQKWF